MSRAPSAKTREAAKAEVSRAGGDSRAVENAGAIAGTARDVAGAPAARSELAPSTDEARAAAAREGGDREAVDMAAAIGAGAGANLPRDEVSLNDLRSTPRGIEHVADAAGVVGTLTGGAAATSAAREDVLGSAREAPGVGSGLGGGAEALGDVIVDRSVVARPVGDPPALYSELGAFGAAPERVGVGPSAAAAAMRSSMLADLRVRGTAGYPFMDPADEREIRGEPDLIITARRDGFRRGGIAHPAQPTRHYSSDFTELQLRQIAEEPMLHVEMVD